MPSLLKPYYLTIPLIYLFSVFFDTENATVMLTKPRNISPALTLHPEENLLTEFAVIATSPQSPLVREVSGDNADARRREDDSPPSQLVFTKQMVCDRGLRREIRQISLSNHEYGAAACAFDHYVM